MRDLFPKKTASLAVIARSEATKQSILSPHGDMDCFASLAMTVLVPVANFAQNIDDFPHLKRWLETIRARPATERAYAKAKEVNPNFGQPVNRTEEERRILFGQTAAVVR